MFPFNKIIVVALAVLALGAGAALAASRGGGSDDPVGPTTSTPAPKSTVEDVKGPCDEAEHANDPRCAGAQIPEDNDAAENEDANHDNGQADDDAAENEDVNDNDQAEANNSGPGNAPDEEADEDNSGPSENSGPGSGGADDGDHSGHGASDDD